VTKIAWKSVSKVPSKIASVERPLPITQKTVFKGLFPVRVSIFLETFSSVDLPGVMLLDSLLDVHWSSANFSTLTHFIN